MLLIPKGLPLGRSSYFCAIVSSKRVKTFKGSSKLLLLIKDQNISAEREKGSERMLVKQGKIYSYSCSILNLTNSLPNSFYSFLKLVGIRTSKIGQYLEKFRKGCPLLIYTKWRISGPGQNSWWLISINLLPRKVLVAPSLEFFKARLDRTLSNLI